MFLRKKFVVRTLSASTSKISNKQNLKQTHKKKKKKKKDNYT